MAFIHLPPISPLLPEGRIQIRPDAGMLPLVTPGQVLEARVLGRLDGEHLLIHIQNRSMVARAALPLQAGETLQLRVEGLKPLLTLALLDTSAGESVRTGEALRVMRSDPQALAKSLTALLEALPLEHAASRPVREDAGRVLQLLRSLVFSQNTAVYPLWVRDSLHSLGLLVESKLRKALQQGSTKALQDRTVSLKELLLRLIDVLRREGGGESGKGFTQKLSLFEGALKNIENLQVLNVLFQEQEGKYLFQIPFLLSGRMATADIFVRVDRDRPGEKKGPGVFHVVFALRMDALGDVMVHAKWKGKKIDCRIECESEDIRHFIALSLTGLAERLGVLGFQAGEMTCAVKKDLGRAREDLYRKELSLTAVDLSP